MNEVQKIILTCLLGPEDKTAFRKFQNAARSLKRYHALSKEEKQLRLEEGNKWRRENRERVNEASRSRHAEDPSSRRESSTLWKQLHPEQASESAKKARRKRLKKAAEYANSRYAEEVGYRLERVLRSRLAMALKGVKGKKTCSALKLLGCSVPCLENHLESLFKPGMTWENHGPVWHIDHIKPCAAFDLTDLEQQKICFHWSNFQPLFALENLQKSDKYVV